MSHSEFLDTVYAYEDKDELISFIFDYVGDMLQDGKYDECNDLLGELDVDQLEVNGILSFLTISNCVKHRFPNRAIYLDRAFGRTIKLVGRKEAKQLLDGFKEQEGQAESGLMKLFRVNIMGYPE